MYPFLDADDDGGGGEYKLKISLLAGRLMSLAGSCPFVLLNMIAIAWQQASSINTYLFKPKRVLVPLLDNSKLTSKIKN